MDGDLPLGWWSLSGESLMNMLRRCSGGEDPDMVYAEAYANSEHECVEDDDEPTS